MINEGSGPNKKYILPPNKLIMIPKQRIIKSEIPEENPLSINK